MATSIRVHSQVFLVLTLISKSVNNEHYENKNV